MYYPGMYHDDVINGETQQRPLTRLCRQASCSTWSARREHSSGKTKVRQDRDTDSRRFASSSNQRIVTQDDEMIDTGLAQDWHRIIQGKTTPVVHAQGGTCTTDNGQIIDRQQTDYRHRGQSLCSKPTRCGFS